MAHIVAGVFRSELEVEQAIRSLRGAQFTDDEIGVIAGKTRIGRQVADVLGREYCSRVRKSDDMVNGTAVYAALPDAFIDIVHQGSLPEDAVDWYQEQLAEGYIVLIVDAGDRSSEVTSIMRSQGGVGYPVHRPSTVATMTTPIEVRVERQPLAEPVRPEDYRGVYAEGGVLRMPIVEEEVYIVKTPVVREEIVITRAPVTEEKVVRETVMHAEPGLESHGKVEGTVFIEEDASRRPAA